MSQATFSGDNDLHVDIVDIVDIEDSRYLYLQPGMFNGDNDRLMTLMTSVQITD